MCRNASDGSTCGAGYPFSLYHTSIRATGYYDATTKHIWHPTHNNVTAGWECVDVSGTPVSCATRFVSAGTNINAGYDSNMDVVVIGRELYSISIPTGSLTCLNLDTVAPCAGQPYAGFGGTNETTSGITGINGKVYTLVNSTMKCFDPATKAACAGMQWPKAGGTQPVLAVPSADGVVRNVCSNGACWSLDGSAHTLPAAFINYINANNVSALAAYGPSYQMYAGAATAGTRLFWPMVPGVMGCFDFAAGAVCPNFPITIPVQYTVAADPVNSNCVWTNSDDGVIRTWDVPTGTAGCKAPPPPPPVATYYPQAVIPRLACDAGPGSARGRPSPCSTPNRASTPRPPSPSRTARAWRFPTGSRCPCPPARCST